MSKILKKARRGSWTNDETFFLIDTILEMNIIRKIDGFRGRNQKYYQRIADEFGRRNLHKDWEQISSKWKNLKCHYYQHLKEALESDQEAHIQWPFYEKMNNVLSRRPRTIAFRRKMSGDPNEEEDVMDSDELSDVDDNTVSRLSSEESTRLRPPSPNIHHESELPSSTSDERGGTMNCTTTILGQAGEQGVLNRAESQTQHAPRQDLMMVNEELNAILKAIAGISEPKPEEADCDKLFLLSLHACVKSLSFEKNVQFRIGVMKLLLQLKNGDQ